MKKAGQGALEYLMTYGWAVLVVIVVGAAMWRLGVFNMQGTAPTSQGFQVFKPLLATCKAGKQTYYNQQPGFMCVFVNAAGRDVDLYDVKVWTNNETCKWQWLTDAQRVNDLYSSSDWKVIYRWCGDNHGGCGLPACYYYRNTSHIPCPLNIGQDNSFILFQFTDDGRNDVCTNVASGGIYETSIDLEYELNIGGSKVRKHDTGKIRMTAE